MVGRPVRPLFRTSFPVLPPDLSPPSSLHPGIPLDPRPASPLVIRSAGMSATASDKPSLLLLFLAGRHADVVSRALLDDDAGFLPDETPAVVSSLAALGQPGDADALLSHQRDLLAPADQAFALYHLASTAVTGGRYDEARRYLVRLFALRHHLDTPAGLFFVFQGIA